MSDLSAHPAADIFPLLPEDELQQLADNIAANGLLYPIILFDGLVLDGRNRLAACELASVVPTFDHWTGDDPIAYVISCNIARRHLNKTQAAFCALAFMSLYVEQARERMAQGGEGGVPGEGTQLVEYLGEAAQHAAKQFHTNRQYIYDAKRIATERPDLAKQCIAGTLSLKRAKGVLNRESRVAAVSDAPELPTGKLYPVIYADPPWRYEQARTDTRAMETHYDTMALEDICALEVSELAHEHAVLFLWTTSPKLAESIEVIPRWGFDYRTCMIWDKQQIGMGNYVRQQHELLLIAARGNLPIPKPANLSASIVCAKRGKHSEKPQEFRDIIEAMYPEYPRIELFARTAVPGWDRWGNEA
jgi:N6-adenosine-specific RNA methylase IME4